MLALLALLTLAQTDAGTGVLTRPPALVQKVEATFPAEMLDAGTGGTVVMEIDLDDTGKVTDAKVVKSAGEAFDRSALEAIRQFTFSPAEIDGKPAAVRLQYSYTFFFKQQVEQVEVFDGGFDDAGVRMEPANLVGTLVERGTRVALPGATVVVGEGEGHFETVSDDEGYFELKGVPVGTYKVIVTAPDYEKYVTEEEVLKDRRTEVRYYVRRKVYGAFETTVRAKKERKDVASISLKQEEIRLIPGTNGDAFRVIQNLPGVARIPYGLGFLVIRGSKPWDTRTYVDDASVPLLFHFGGLYATFNSSLIETLNFQPGNFGADYGRNIGGIVSADVRPPSQTSYHGYVDVNVIDSSALFEGPITEDWSFAVSGRRSYIDAVLPLVFDWFVPSAKDALSFTVAPRYYDWQVRLERKPKNGVRFFVQFFGSDDKLKFVLPNPAVDPEGRGSFGTAIAYDRLNVGIDAQLSDSIRFRSRNNIGLDTISLSAGSDVFAKATQYPITTRDVFTIDLPALHTVLDVGVDMTLLPYQLEVQGPPTPKLDSIPDPYISRQLIYEKAFRYTFEPAVFAEAIIKPWPWLKVVAGLRADFESQMNRGWVDPRLAVFVSPWESTVFKGAVGLYHQSPDYRLGELDPVFGNPHLLPEAASHYMIGAEHHFTDAISLDVQLYYKDIFHEARPTLSLATGDVSSMGTDLHYTSNGIGRDYGVEVLLRHQLTKNFFGWIAYSLSRSERSYFGGQKYGLAPFDQPHNLIVVLSYKLPYDFIAGTRIRYTTGGLYTPVNGAIYDGNANYYYPLYGQPFSKRLPDFFQLDVRIDKRFVFQRWMLAVYLDVQNVTNRYNTETILYNYNYTQQHALYGLPILPSLGIRGEW